MGSSDQDSVAKLRVMATDVSPEIIDTYARLRPQIARIAKALLRDDADADDATQASLLEILRSASSFRAEGSFDAWAKRVSVRTILRMARQRRVRGLRLDEAEPDTMPSEAPEPSSRDGLPRDVADYLSELPETRRTALVLRHVLGYSVDEIADLTGVSSNTVKDRLLAAREQVRRRVRQDVATGTRGRRP